MATHGNIVQQCIAMCRNVQHDCCSVAHVRSDGAMSLDVTIFVSVTKACVATGSTWIDARRRVFMLLESLDSSPVTLCHILSCKHDQTYSNMLNTLENI